MSSIVGIQQRGTQGPAMVNPNDVRTSQKVPRAGVTVGEDGSMFQSRSVEFKDNAGGSAIFSSKDTEIPVVKRLNHKSASDVAGAKLAAQDEAPIGQSGNKSVEDVVKGKIESINNGIKEISTEEIKALAKKENLDETVLTTALEKADF